MRCQPIAPNSNLVSFKSVKKNPENKDGETNKNTGFKIILKSNNDTFELTKIPQQGGILDNDTNR